MASQRKGEQKHGEERSKREQRAEKDLLHALNSSLDDILALRKRLGQEEDTP